MSITLSSDDSNHEDNIKENAADDCVDLTQEYGDIPFEARSCSPNYDEFIDLPPVQLSGTQVASLAVSRGTSDNSAGSSTSGYGSTSSAGRPRGVESTEDKSKKKRTAAADKLAKKQKVAEERAAKQAAAEMNKVYKPGECMKYMHIEVHPTLLSQWYFADVEREVTSAGARLEPCGELCDAALVLWSRRVPRGLRGLDGQMELSPSRERCPRALYVCLAADIASHVRTRTLATHVAEAKALADCPLTLVVHGVKEYFKPANRRTQNSNRDIITEIEFEMALTDLLVNPGCDTAIVNTPNELALLIVQVTKAIAEEPHKKLKRSFDEQAEFYMRGDNKKCVPMDKDGNGASRLWQQMIAVLPGSSLETSRSVCGQYKSPLALYQALQLPNGVNGLADIGVARAGVPGCKARRLGPEFARKLCTLFTAVDGDILLD